MKNQVQTVDVVVHAARSQPFPWYGPHLGMRAISRNPRNNEVKQTLFQTLYKTLVTEPMQATGHRTPEQAISAH